MLLGLTSTTPLNLFRTTSGPRKRAEGQIPHEVCTEKRIAQEETLINFSRASASLWQSPPFRAKYLMWGRDATRHAQRKLISHPRRANLNRARVHRGRLCQGQTRGATLKVQSVRPSPFRASFADQRTHARTKQTDENNGIGRVGRHCPMICGINLDNP